jgi:hypothetical protein
MNGSQTDLLTDTYHLIQLARETALARGSLEQAQRLGPLSDQIGELITSRQASGASAPASQPASPTLGVMGQSDFQKLLSVVQSSTPAEASPTGRHPVVMAMASAGMSELDIARHMGMTRQEVHLILALNQSQKSSTGVQPR